MKSTRDLIRDLLAARREATVGQLAQALGLNQANIRRHLEVMRAEGLVDARIQRRDVGRPSFLYRLTERAEELSAHYPRLLSRMVRRLTAEGGPEAVEQVFAGVADEVVRVHKPAVFGATV